MWLNPKQSQISMSSFPFSAEKSGKGWRSSQSGYCYSIITYFKNEFIHNKIEFRKTAGRRRSAVLNLKYSRIGTASFPLLAEKSRKRWRSTVKVGIVIPLLWGSDLISHIGRTPR